MSSSYSIVFWFSHFKFKAISYTIKEKLTSWSIFTVFKQQFSCFQNWNVKKVNLYINLACLSVCLSVFLFVCLYPINVKTAEPIGPKFFVGHLGTPGKVYEWSKFQIFVSIKIRSSLNFWKFWKSTKFFVKIRELFLLCFTMYTENMFTINLEDGREAPSKASNLNIDNWRQYCTVKKIFNSILSMLISLA